MTLFENCILLGNEGVHTYDARMVQ
jgi:hypothetical protein